MTTPLYKEALIESQKLRQLAIEEAKQAVLDSITPHIKSILEKEISGPSSNLFEEEELPADGLDPMAQPNPLEAPATDAPPPPQMDSATVPPTETVTTPAAETTALPSVDAAPIPSPSMGGMPLPGPDGTITIDLNAMFDSKAGTNPTQGVEQPPIQTQEPAAPLPATDEALPADPSLDPIGQEMPSEPSPTGSLPQEDQNLQPLRENITRVERNILKTIAEKKLTNYAKSSFEKQLFNLFEVIQTLKAAKKNNLKVDEARLNHIYGKLQKDNNSYQGQIKENKEMATKSLKAFTAALFEEASAGFGDSSESPSKDIVNSMNGAAGEKASKKAMSASKSTPVEDPGKDQSLTVSESEEMEMLEAELREMLGEEEEEVMEEEVEDHEEEAADLKEQLRALKLKEAKVLRKLKECGMGGTPVINIEIQTGEGGAEVNASGMGAEEPEMDMGAEDEMADDSVDFGGPDGEVELVDDSEEADGSDDMESELGSGEEESEEEEEETAEVEESPSMVAENKNLKKQLSETQMLMARSLYVNKLFARDNLSGTQKRKIVEYLDGARTIQEAKEVYGRIKKVLDESASKTAVNEGKKKTVGSSSSVTRKASINESVDNSGLINWTADTNRWQTLAGIKK